MLEMHVEGASLVVLFGQARMDLELVDQITVLLFIWTVSHSVLLCSDNLGYKLVLITTIAHRPRDMVRCCTEMQDTEEQSAYLWRILSRRFCWQFEQCRKWRRW